LAKHLVVTAGDIFLTSSFCFHYGLDTPLKMTCKIAVHAFLALRGRPSLASLVRLCKLRSALLPHIMMKAAIGLQLLIVMANIINLSINRPISAGMRLVVKDGEVERDENTGIDMQLVQNKASVFLDLLDLL
jgi:hypothetical protein